jgi:MarR family transcriptional regulator, 2-MHQ and catechol-resistance regulon repressor
MGRSQDRALKLFVVLHRAAAAVTAHAEADVARHGLSLAEFAAMEALHHKGPLLVGELQRAVLKSSGGITYVVDRLQEKGLVRRRPCPDDRRALYAELTPEGTTRMEEIFPAHAAAIEAAVAGLSARDQEQAVALLKQLGLGAAARAGGGANAAPSPRTGTAARTATGRA